MENLLKEILKELQGIKSDVSLLKESQIRVEKKVDGLEQGQKEIKYQLSEFQIEYSNTMKDLSNKVDEIKTDVKSIEKDLCRVEEATAHNWVDIAKLKAFK